MKRLAMMLVTGLVVASAAHAQNPYATSTKPTLNVKNYGAKGDGVTDDYNALRSAAAAINANRGGTLYFPAGTYRINRYRTKSNGIGNIVFSNCDNLIIDGYGAKIEVKGDFYRTADISSIESSYNSVVPLSFQNCKNFTVQGLELDGNVELMSRPSTVIEGPSHGIVTNRCSYYTFKDLNIHHFAGDGVYIGDNASYVDRYALMERVITTNNARDGISIIQLRDGKFNYCQYTRNGLQQGTYAPHAPYSGVNVEPYKNSVTDYKTGNLTFTGCTLSSNGNSQLQAAGTNKENITFSQCTIDKGTSNYINTINFAALNGVLDGCTLIVNQIVPSWDKYTGTRTTIRNCQIKTNGRAITDYITSGSRTVLIEGNTFTGTHTTAATQDMILIRNPGTTFRNNTVFVPKAAKNSSTTQCITTISYAAASTGNTFYTDYVTTGSQHFYSNYTGTVSVSSEAYATDKYYRKAANASYTGTTTSTATNVAFSRQPAGAVAAKAFTTQPVIVVRTSSGTTATTYTGPVTVAIKSGTGTSGAILSGTTTVNAVAGIATFTNLTIDKAGTGYVLVATSGSLTSASSTAFDVTTGTTSGGTTTTDASHIKYLTQPAGAVAGKPFTTQPKVVVRNLSGVTVTSFNGPITMSIKSGTGTSGARLLGTVTVNAVAGVATFTNLAIDLAGSGYVLVPSSGTLIGYNSTAFTVSAATSSSTATTDASHLKFTVQPGGAYAGRLFATQPTVVVRNLSGYTATSFNGPITLSIKSGTGTSGAILGGTRTVNAVNGVATFTNLTIDKAGAGYVLVPSSGTLIGYNSATFTVNP